ncbi:polyamine ABC transporter substrate-binding protein [Catenovulum sediminis]|uniref:Putrescine-binding periplasmic protein n=1 Tax=Catenovulum sediminis TaxID=1740262 RepID=A0ABV1RLR3_9ALTE
MALQHRTALLIIVLPLLLPNWLSANTLTVLNWPDYLSDTLIKQFEKRENAKLKFVYYDSDDARDKLLNLNNAQGYDIIVTSRVRIDMYVEQNWLLKLDKKQLPNTKYIKFSWFEFANKNGFYCVPYTWGTTGILYNAQKIPSPPQTWAEFFNQTNRYSKKIRLLNDSRTLLPMALIALGYDSHSNDKNNIKQATELLYRQLPNIHSFSALNLDSRSLFLNDSIWISMAYNGDAEYLQKQKPELRFIQPRDGTNIWLDCLTISAKSSDPQLAYRFINFLHAPENAAKTSSDLRYATTNEQAIKHMPNEIKNNRIIYPAIDKLDNAKLTRKLPPATERYFHTAYKQLLFAHKKLNEVEK